MRFLPTLSLLCLFPIVLAACAPAELGAPVSGIGFAFEQGKNRADLVFVWK